jgi:hypothetical protein
MGTGYVRGRRGRLTFLTTMQPWERRYLYTFLLSFFWINTMNCAWLGGGGVSFKKILDVYDL